MYRNYLFSLRSKTNGCWAISQSRQCWRPSSTQTQQLPQNVEDISKSSDQPQSTSIIKSKLPQREPLVRNFFVGKVDNELLGFPEVISREDMATLKDETSSILTYFSSIKQSSDTPRPTLNDSLEDLRKLDLFGYNCPKKYGGRGWQLSQTLLACELESEHTAIACGLLTHRVLIDTLTELGTDEQKDMYLSKLAQGSILSTEAVFEYDEPEEGIFNSTAQYDPYDGSWTLNGVKSFVVNGPFAGLYLVVAETKQLTVSETSQHATTIFLVDRNTPGVEVGELHKGAGPQGVVASHVHFNNVKVMNNGVLGQPHEGYKTADVIMRSSRLRFSQIGLSLSKKIINQLSEYVVHNKRAEIPLKDLDSTQKYIATLFLDTYAMESMLYYTAGLFDEFDSQDIGLESAVVKYYTLTRLRKNIGSIMDIIGPKSLLDGQPTEAVLQDTLRLYAMGETLGSLMLFISLHGLQYAGCMMQDVVRKSRNPLFHPGHIFSKFMEGSTLENPKIKFRLGDNLHPSLIAAAQCIEKSIVRLQMTVEVLLTRYGPEVVEKHIDIHRITEMVACIYAMFASSSRASRSYCIGLQFADNELLLALSICAECEEKVKRLATEVFNGPYINNDRNVNRLSKQIFESSCYYPVHPLTYNF